MNGHDTPAETLERLRKEAKFRFKGLQRGEEQAVRWYRRTLPDGPSNPTLRDVQLAIARSLDFPGWTALKRSLSSQLPEPTSREGILHRFLDNACPDHHVRGAQDHRRAVATALRLLEQHPWLSRHDFNTAVVCGEIDVVRAAIARDPRVAVVASTLPSRTRALPGKANDLYGHYGPKGWVPISYLCFTRLPLKAVDENAVEILQMLLDAGADPNVYYHAGGSHYTPMTGVAGEGEEDRPPHSRRVELTQLLLDRGAHPYDMQVVYNLGFHCEYMWWLPMIHASSIARGHAADWNDPEWQMLSMGGYGCGARWFLEHAVTHNKPDLAAWCLAHGASANAPPQPNPVFSQRPLYEEAVITGRHEIAELLLQHGATRTKISFDPVANIEAAAFRLDRAAVNDIIRQHPEVTASPRPLFHAADSNRADVINLLIDAGFSPDVADDKNTRALNHAAWANAIDAARALVARGAEIDPVEENYGGTPFGGASHFLNREVMDFLAPLTKDVWNLTYDGRVDRLRALFAEKPERARVDWGEWSPLLWLPPDDEDTALDVVKLYVEYGADVHRRDANGVAPVDKAAALGMTRVVDYLRGLAAEAPERRSS